MVHFHNLLMLIVCIADLSWRVKKGGYGSAKAVFHTLA